jgi:multisubunit Na+/H+ antiporter MnhE subunit
MPTIIFLILLYLFYLFSTGIWNIANFLLGLLVCAITAYLIRVPLHAGMLRQWKVGKLWQALRAMLVYFVRLFVEWLVSGFTLLGLVLSPHPIRLKSGIVAIPTGSPNPLIAAISAYSITVTPGEMVVKIDEKGILYTHTLDVNVTKTNSKVSQLRRTALLMTILGEDTP